LLFAVSTERGIRYWYAMMETALDRHLARLGISFRSIGPAVEHRGRRQPMVARVEDARARIQAVNPSFHRLIVDIGKLTREHTQPVGDPRSAVGQAGIT
jgi:N-acyl amino acid synthase of PEP-CTERM/exosortase system